MQPGKAYACLIGFGVALLAVPATPARQPSVGAPRSPIENFDIRVVAPERAARLAASAVGRSSSSLTQALEQRRATVADEVAWFRREFPGARIRGSALLGNAEVVSRPGAALTAASPGRKGADILRDFMSRHPGLYGLSPSQVDALHSIGESTRAGGVRIVRLQQYLAGRPVFQGWIRGMLDPSGRLVATAGLLAPELPENAAPGAELAPAISLKAALSLVGLDVEAGAVGGMRPASGPWSTIFVDHADLPRAIRSQEVYFPLGPGAVVPARSYVITSSAAGDWYLVVDSRTGELLFRKNLRVDASTEEARFRVYVQPGDLPADSPSPGTPNAFLPGSGTQPPELSPVILEMSSVQDPVASPDGWIPDGGETTSGNNVDAYLDRDFDDAPDPILDGTGGRPVGNPDVFGRNRDFLGNAPRDFEYTPAPLGGNPDAGDDPLLLPAARGILTQLFYNVNIYHDRLYQLGFDEVAGNHQVDNFGRGGLQGDPIEAQAQLGADFFFCCNASASPAPDGVPTPLWLSLFTDPDPDRDPSLDAETVFHELTHTVTNRLLGDGTGLTWAVGGALGEGWSDFYALSLLNDQPTDDPDGQYPLGGYIGYGLNGFTDNYVYGLRRFPYTTDNGINPLTWADVDETTIDLSGGLPPSPRINEHFGAFEVHAAGELWALSLWEVRSRIIASLGGDVAAGNGTLLQIVTDALNVTPANPGFTEARDALFVADCAANDCANEEAIWAGFADRGLGYGAEASLGHAIHAGIRESFSPPFLDVGQVIVDDSAGNRNGFIDPGETISLVVELTNPWLNPAKGVSSVTATLSTSTHAARITDPRSSYGELPAQGTATGDPFVLRLAPGASCGRSLKFSLQAESALGVTSAPFTLRVGQPTGPGDPVIFTRTIRKGLPIPDAQGVLLFPVIDTLRISEDLEIVDLDLRLDELLHTAVGNLWINLRAPSGFGADLIAAPGECDPVSGSCFLGNNQGDNFINTVIDGDATADLETAGAAAAPFTGSWFPTINSMAWGSASDPVNQMEHYTGTSTQGDWQLFITDFQPRNSGQLDAWSLIVTPMEYACQRSRP